MSATATFPIQTLSLVAEGNAEPTYHTIKQVQRELNSNAASVYSTEGGGDNGHLTLTITPAEYLIIAGVQYNAPAAPPAQPIVPVGGTAAQITEAIRLHTEQCRVFKLYNDTDKALVKQLIAATPLTYIEALQDDNVGFARVTCLQMLTHLYTEYGQISLAERDANQQRMAAAWSPPTPITHLFRQLQQGVTFAAASGEPAIDTQVARLGYTIILKTGLFPDACREWRLRAAAQQTFAEFQTFFRRMDRDRQESTTTAASGYSLTHNVYDPSIVTPPAITEVTLPHPTIPAVIAPTAAASINSATTLSADMTALLAELTFLRQQSKTPRNQRLPVAAPLSYCWTHGFTKNLKHNSTTCRAKAPGHVDHATANDMQGGTTRVATPRR
jgi:hypothetical protein